MTNQDYKILADDLIHNAFNSDQTPRGKISDERQYAELILRKLLAWDKEKQLTLGDNKVKAAINATFDPIDPSFTNFVIDAVETIRAPGNRDTHTQHRGVVTEQDLDTVTDAVFDLLASLFIDYFLHKYKPGSNLEVLSSFSLLPPIIRYKVWKYLYERGAGGSTDRTVIDKLVLAILKSQGKDGKDVQGGKDAALSWVENHKEELASLKAVSAEAYERAKIKFGSAVAEKEYSKVPSMYKVCKDKIEDVSKQIEENGGLLYPDFETSKKYYLAKGILKGNEPEVVDFNDLMEFIYLGRKEADVEVKPPMVTMRVEVPKIEDVIMDELMNSGESE